MDLLTEQRVRDVAHLSPVARSLRTSVTRWALARGVGVDFDGLTLILATRDEHGDSPRQWTEDDVWRLWWLDLTEWCSTWRISPPAHLAGALESLLGFLADTRDFEAPSDPLHVLLEAMDAAGATASRESPTKPAVRS